MIKSPMVLLKAQKNLSVVATALWAVPKKCAAVKRFCLRRCSNMQYWEIVADKLGAARWSWGYCSAVTREGWRWIVDAHCDDGKRYIVQSDELLSAFLELKAMLL